MKSAYEIIKKPIVTEKGTRLQKGHNQVIFEVDKEANKIDIKRAIENLFNVKIEKVATINVLGKKKRVGVHRGKKPNRKKAIVTLAPGQSIELLGTP